VEETSHGRKIRDPYRWLENSDTPETQEFVRQQWEYARSVLDSLPGREQIRQRLTELLAIGTIGTPQVGGNFYFYFRREGSQNQPIIYVREGVNAEDRALIDPNQLAADGTIAVDWWYPSHDGKYVAYGLSAGGSEMSTLRVIETGTGTVLPDTIERTRAASLAWRPDQSGFFYTRYPRKGDVPAGEEVYHRCVFYHSLGTDPEKDLLIFGEGRNPED
jgi:prolyl oligopeptidase